MKFVMATRMLHGDDKARKLFSTAIDAGLLETVC
jgi:hypothetical protein